MSLGPKGRLSFAVLRMTLRIGSCVKERVEKATGKLTWSFGRHVLWLKRFIYLSQGYDSLKMRGDENR